MQIKKYHKLFLLIVWSVLFSSCTDFFEKEIPHPEYVEKLVVNGILDPSEAEIIISVTKTRPIYGNDRENAQKQIFVDDALVVITDGINRDTLALHQFNAGQYSLLTSEYPLEAGKTYTIEVTTPESWAKASTTIPARVVDENSIKLNYDTIVYRGVDNDVRKRGITEIKFQDLPESGSYYRLSANIQRLPFDQYFIHFGAIYFTITDKDKNGSEIGPIRGENTLSRDEDLDGFQAVINLEMIDENLYRYYNYLNGLNEDNGLFTEPAITFSNVDNGLGIVGSRRKLIKRIDL